MNSLNKEFHVEMSGKPINSKSQQFLLINLISTDTFGPQAVNVTLLDVIAQVIFFINLVKRIIT
jgi:hypothetical protein